MRSVGIESCLATTGADRVDPEIGLRTFPRRQFPYRLGRSPEMFCWLDREVASGAIDIVHNHGNWMMPNVYPGWATRGTNVPLVVSPRGTFSRWAMSRSWAIKSLFWNTLQKRSIANAALFHATAESEYEDIRRLGFRQPVVVIPNGIDIPHTRRNDVKSEGNTLLFVSRVHPKKGIDLLLKSWAQLQNRHSDWRLRIVGPGDPAYVRELLGLAAALRVERVTFEGPLYGAEKERAYQSAHLFVLPTHSENFGMAVAEALAAGVPVITTKGAPWAGLVGQRAGWWVDIGTEPLRLVLDEAMSKQAEELAEMGGRGRTWMQRDFSWDRIAAQMIESYRWIHEGGNRPKWIYVD